MRTVEFPVATADGHEASLLARMPDSPRSALLWLPALGVAAKHYIPFAEALAERGVAVFLHEWRGNGSSNQRAGRDCDWGYRELFADIAASEATMQAHANDLPRILGGHSLGGQLACWFASMLCRDFDQAIEVTAQIRQPQPAGGRDARGTQRIHLLVLKDDQPVLRDDVPQENPSQCIFGTVSRDGAKRSDQVIAVGDPFRQPGTRLV